MAQQQRNIKARYHTRFLGEQDVTFKKCWMEVPEGATTPIMMSEFVTEKRECWLVSFPQGHSIRLTDRKELERMGYHLKPRMVDMDTGDVVELGGDPYDFAQPGIEPIVMDDEDITPTRTRPTRAKEEAS